MFTLIFALIMSICQHYGPDKLVLLTTKSKVVTADEEPELHEIVKRLSILAEYHIQKNRNYGMLSGASHSKHLEIFN